MENTRKNKGKMEREEWRRDCGWKKRETNDKRKKELVNDGNRKGRNE